MLFLWDNAENNLPATGTQSTFFLRWSNQHTHVDKWSKQTQTEQIKKKNFCFVYCFIDVNMVLNVHRNHKAYLGTGLVSM